MKYVNLIAICVHRSFCISHLFLKFFALIDFTWKLEDYIGNLFLTILLLLQRNKRLYNLLYRALIYICDLEKWYANCIVKSSREPYDGQIFAMCVSFSYRACCRSRKLHVRYNVRAYFFLSVFSNETFFWSRIDRIFIRKLFRFNRFPLAT